jgi:hypothetical protein
MNIRENIKKNRFNVARIIFSIGAIIAVILKLFDTKVGERIDAMTIGLFIAAFIPWFMKYISKIAIPGFLEADIHRLEDKIETTNKEVQSINNIVQNTQDALILGVENNDDVNYTKEQIETELKNIGEEYVNIRKNMPSGNHRTQLMDNLFRKMVDISKNNGTLDKYDEWISTDRAELHLPAIAYLFAHPQFARVSSLIDIIEKTGQPFVQYWALRVLQRVINSGGEFSLNDIYRLENITSSLANATDRSRLLSSILSKIKTRMR